MKNSKKNRRTAEFEGPKKKFRKKGLKSCRRLKPRNDKNKKSKSKSSF